MIISGDSEYWATKLIKRTSRSDMIKINIIGGRLGIVPYDLARTGGITQWDNPLVSTEKSLDETGSRHIADQNHKVIVLEDDIIGPSECNATTLPSIEFSLERNLSHLSRRLNMQSTVSLTPRTFKDGDGNTLYQQSQAHNLMLRQDLHLL
ncbi:hypothetical protein Tco_0632938 [Tanacetum coccineum]